VASYGNVIDGDSNENPVVIIIKNLENCSIRKHYSHHQLTELYEYIKRFSELISIISSLWLT
ncbi:hypothetical protein L9F63_023388, partial [Diploptera punctata]